MEYHSNDFTKLYDAAIVGGGLAGLSLAIQLAKAGYKVILFEKEKYPFHKVCGEYISMESWKFIEELDLPLKQMNLPVVNKLIVSSPNGNRIKSDLQPGGFGISRYILDDELRKIAEENGVKVMDGTKVNDISFSNNNFTITTSAFKIHSKIAAGAFGKRSNIDVKWSREFIKQKANKLNNYIGIKYHVKTDLDPGTIALHNFQDGYCGISKIENDKYCLCYLTTANNLQSNDNSIAAMEKNVLQKNPHLKNIFNNAEFLYASPITISQISFSKKSRIENNVLLIGDAAGMITPLCGNGMSMALHSGKIVFKCVNRFLKNEISRTEMENQYDILWKKYFSNRLKYGRILQSFFGKAWLTNIFISTLKPFPGLVKSLISATHGEPF